jgi:hypothetical protein
MLRTSDEVILDLQQLIATKGYIYSLCLILFEDFHVDLDKIHQIDPQSRLSVKECTLILGFLVQGKIDFSFPESPELTFSRKERTYELMSELHFAYSAPQMSKLRALMERQKAGIDRSQDPENRVDFFAKDGAIIEPTFYSGDGVYDFQYLEYLLPKYRYDQEWLFVNRQFDINQVSTIVKRIKSLLYEKGKSVDLRDLKTAFANMQQKARKKLKGLTIEEFEKSERQAYVSASFFQYRKLFPSPETGMKDSGEGWASFYANLIELFIVRESDFETSLNVTVFFENFSFEAPANLDYFGVGYYNVINSRPLIKLDNDRYFVPINYLIPEAVYESPFYWMLDDEHYRPTLAKHRGDVGEEITFDYLSSVFGVENTYKSVLIFNKKGEPETDVDVLCLLGNKALCVQVKSKKLTLMARRGDFDQLSKDFKGAIQDAYKQGLVSRKCLLERTAQFVDQNGDVIKRLKDINIDEVYILGLTTENYPSLVHQVFSMLEKEEQDPFPLFISIFDLELLAHYLKDPYDFLYYVRQRTELSEYFRAAEEMIYLGYHLDQKLWKLEGSDQVMLDTDYGGIIDRNYYPYKTGLSHILSSKNDPIQNRWKGEKFEFFTTMLKESGHTKTTDIIFHLMDQSGQTRENVVEQIINLKQKSLKGGMQQTLATDSRPNFGLSYVVINDMDPEKLDTITEVYATLRKYKSKCDCWLGLGAFAESRSLIDMILYLDEPWRYDAMLEDECAKFFKPNIGKIVPLSGHGKIGRNDPCICKSGKKYKKCCGVQ